jgi:putative membrane protein
MQGIGRVIIALAAGALSPFAAPAQTAPAADSGFMVEAAQGGMAEVEMGRIAVQNASDAKVKQFGQRMVDDHSKANAELKTVAAQKGVKLPAQLDAKHRGAAGRLSKLHGAAFDKAYIDGMVKDHREDVAEFERQANGASDAAVKAFAAKTLPTLREHLKMAEDAQSALKKSN